MPNEALMANRRCSFPLACSWAFRRASHARPLPWAAVAYLGRSPEMRAERAKPKSRRDDMLIAQGQRGTSAALGERYNMISSLFSNLVWRAGAPNQIGKKRAWVGVAVYPGRRPGAIAQRRPPVEVRLCP